jgi:hypothetical protein
LIFKELVFGTALLRCANRFVRQQQRNEIMQCFALLVNPLFFFSALDMVDQASLTRCFR